MEKKCRNAFLRYAYSLETCRHQANGRKYNGEGQIYCEEHILHYFAS